MRSGSRFITMVVLFALGPAGCGKSSNRVSGKVTCDDQPVTGSILFSPLGEGPDNTGQAVAANLNADGTFQLELKTVGKHRVVVSPSDVAYPAKPGEEHKCDLSPVEREIKPGSNQIDVPLRARKK